MLYLSFKFVRKFKFCVSPLVKRYPGAFAHMYIVCHSPVTGKQKTILYALNNHVIKSLSVTFELH